MVKNITEVMIQAVMDKHRAKVVETGRHFNNSSENRYLAKLKAILNWGVKAKMIDSNPAANMKDKIENGARTEYFTQEQLQALLNDPLTEAYMKHMILMAVMTGLRRGELLALKWTDINLEARVLFVRQSKSGKQRSIKINDTLLGLLESLPSKGKCEHVFTHERKHKKTGETIGQGPIAETNHEWRRATKRAGLDHFRFHDTRHSFASHIVLASGSVPKTLQEQLGHSTISMTERYSHVADEAKLATVRSLDNLKLTIPSASGAAEASPDSPNPVHDQLPAGVGILQVF
jgi:integrase